MGEHLKVADVFGIASDIRPSSYIDRGRLDETIGELLEDNEVHIALRGESRMGKSWLRQKLIPDAIVVQCRFGHSNTDIYRQALSQLGLRLEVSTTVDSTLTGQVEAGGEVGFKLLAKASAKVGGSYSKGNVEESRPAVAAFDDLPLIAEILKESGRRLVIEDFHYLSRAQRKLFASDLKAMWDLGCRVVVIGVWGEHNLLLHENSDLRGRVEEVSIEWSDPDLLAVLRKGAKKLGIEFADEVADELVHDSYQNVGLLQTLALRVVRAHGIKTSQDRDKDVSSLKTLESSAREYSKQLVPVFQTFAQKVADGIRKRDNSTGIYAHAMAVVLEQDDAMLKAGVPIDLIYSQAHDRQSRIQKPNLRSALSHFDELQVDEEGRGLILTWDESLSAVIVVDRELLFYRKYQAVRWPWQDLIDETDAAAAMAASGDGLGNAR
jgi:hypothetical protein